jgi:hypothetical protein
MSRYNLQLKPGQQIPQDLKIGVQLKPAEISVQTVEHTTTVVQAATKRLWLAGQQQVGGLWSTVGTPGDTTTPAAAIFTVVLSEPIETDLIVTLTSDDIEIGEPTGGSGTTVTILAAGKPSFEFFVTIYQGGTFAITATADGWESDFIVVWANALAHGSDAFADAQAIIAKDTTQSYQGELYPIVNQYFTREAGEPDHADGVGVKSMWWKIKPVADGTLDLDLFSSAEGIDTVMGLYTGASVDALTTIASNDDFSGTDRRSAIIGTPVSGGVTYHIAVAMYNNAAGAAEIRLHYQLDVASIA